MRAREALHFRQRKEQLIVQRTQAAGQERMDKVAPLRQRPLQVPKAHQLLRICLQMAQLSSQCRATSFT